MTLFLLISLSFADADLDSDAAEEVAEASQQVQTASKVAERVTAIDALLSYASDRNVLVEALLQSPQCRPPEYWELPTLGDYEKPGAPDTLVPACVTTCDCLTGKE